MKASHPERLIGMLIGIWAVVMILVLVGLNAGNSDGTPRSGERMTAGQKYATRIHMTEVLADQERLVSDE